MSRNPTLARPAPTLLLPSVSGIWPAIDRPVTAVFVLILLALWLMATMGMRPLLLPDEGRYATVALEMLRGDTLVPTLNDLPFFHKPPLFYWLDMAAMAVFGPGQWSARAGAMVGAWIMGAALFLFLRRWLGARPAVLATVVLATSPFFFIAAQYANHDMLVAGLITAAVLSLVRAVDGPQRVDLRWLAAGAVACALATLAKGLIGFVLPALVVGPWLLMQGRWRQLVGLLHPVGWLVFSVVAMPWFFVMQSRYPGYFDYFVMDQHVRRFVHTTFNNVQPFWFFLLVLPALMLPWTGWVVQTVRQAWRGRDARVGLFVWWIIAVTGFFSLPSSKLVGYVLPVVPPLCALVAMALVRRPGKSVAWTSAVAGLVCVSIVAAIAWQAPKSNRAAALALAQQMAPGDTVVMVDEYLYDVPFYADLRAPVVFASDWRDPELASQDSWRNELVDAARFAPQRGRAVFLQMDQLDRATCAGKAVWFPVSMGKSARVAALTGARRVYGDAKTELWRAPARTCS